MRTEFKSCVSVFSIRKWFAVIAQIYVYGVPSPIACCAVVCNAMRRIAYTEADVLFVARFDDVVRVVALRLKPPR